MSTTLSSYLTIANNLSKWQAYTAQTPDVKTATQYFEKNIGTVTSAKQLVDNPRLFSYAMDAFGLGDQTYAKGLMQRVLQQGVTSSKALANTLDNPNILAFAKAFDFADQGSSVTQSANVVNQVVKKYVENSLESSEGNQDPGVQLALHFQATAPSIKNVYSILADKNLLTVVQTALGISSMTGLEPIDTQANMLKSKLNLADFQDPTKLQNFIERFAAAYDANNNQSGGSAGATSTTKLTDASLLQTTSTLANGIMSISPSTLLGIDNTSTGHL